MKSFQKKYFILILIMFPTYFCVAQQDPIVSNYHLSSSLFNPAYSGLHNRFIVNSTIRRQWRGLPGNPKTNILSVTSSIIKNMLGAGLVVNQDEIGITKTTNLNAQLSYQIPLSSNQIFSFGLQGGFTSISHDQVELNLRFLDDPDFLPISQSATAPNFGAGIALMSDDYFIGLSVPRLISADFNDGLTNNTVYKKHIYAMGSFIRDFTPSFKIKPTALIKYVNGSPISFDLSASLLYDNKLWMGVFTRDFNTQGMMFQLILNGAYLIGYTIEVPTNSYIKAGYITHEIGISIDLAIFKNQDVYLRYF